MLPISHPLAAIPAARRARLFRALLAVTLLLSGVLGGVDQRLRTAPASQGIVSFELARDVPRAAAIVRSWDAGARAAAGFSLGLDFLYLCAYSTTIALACLWAGGVFGARGLGLAGAAAALAWGQWVAAACDAIENVALTVSLLGGVHPPWPRIAWAFASVKFALVVLGILYAAAGAVARAAIAPSRRAVA